MFIKPLSSSRAFSKGVEWFSEIFFFYGTLMALAAYELNKSHKASLESSNRMKRYKN